jgi:hypothetical protein
MAGSESDTSVAKVRLKLRSNRYEVKSITIQDQNPSLTIATLHERTFKLRLGQSIEVYLDDTNPFLFHYPEKPCDIQKLQTTNAQAIEKLNAAVTGSSASTDATSAPSNDTLESDDRTAARATRGACTDKDPRIEKLRKACDLTHSPLDGDLFQNIKKESLRGIQAKVPEITKREDLQAFLVDLEAKLTQLRNHASCVPQLIEETAANLPCVKNFVDSWGDSKTLEDKAQKLSEKATLVEASLAASDRYTGPAGPLLRDAANLPAQAKIVADFLSVLPKVGQPIKVATFEYDRSNNQICTIEIKPDVPGGVGASATSYYWHGTTRVSVVPFSSYSLGVAAGLVYSFVKRPEISTVPDGDKFRVVRKDGKDYTGQGLAAMLTITPNRWRDSDFTPSFEFGINPKSDLGLYLGAGFQLGDHFSLGAGVAFEQVEDLSGGQKPGNKLDKASDLKTEKIFKSGLYLHLTVGTGFDFFKN